jgi:hypothetical protein
VGAGKGKAVQRRGGSGIVITKEVLQQHPLIAMRYRWTVNQIPRDI